MKFGKKKAPRIDERYAWFRLRLDRSWIHGLGVYAAETIPAGRKVIEYHGERISRSESRRRFLKALESSRSPRLYLFGVDESCSLDGAVGGSGAEYINHCCEPNLLSYTANGRVLFKSRRRILPGEELTFDYQYPRDAPKVRCRCGARNCRGTINLK